MDKITCNRIYGFHSLNSGIWMPYSNEKTEYPTEETDQNIKEFVELFPEYFDNEREEGCKIDDVDCFRFMVGLTSVIIEAYMKSRFGNEDNEQYLDYLKEVLNKASEGYKKISKTKHLINYCNDETNNIDGVLICYDLEKFEDVGHIILERIKNVTENVLEIVKYDRESNIINDLTSFKFLSENIFDFNGYNDVISCKIKDFVDTLRDSFVRSLGLDLVRAFYGIGIEDPCYITFDDILRFVNWTYQERFNKYFVMHTTGIYEELFGKFLAFHQVIHKGILNGMNEHFDSCDVDLTKYTPIVSRRDEVVYMIDDVAKSIHYADGPIFPHNNEDFQKMSKFIQIDRALVESMAKSKKDLDTMTKIWINNQDKIDREKAINEVKKEFNFAYNGMLTFIDVNNISEDMPMERFAYIINGYITDCLIVNGYISLKKRSAKKINDQSSLIVRKCFVDEILNFAFKTKYDDIIDEEFEED